MTFAEAIRDLPQAVEMTVAYQNPYTDKWVETERHRNNLDEIAGEQSVYFPPA